ncbi:TonB-dependent receptor plug domain-containing protein [Alistipes communis]|uniref:TonB-dependent receptor plug domain-containing protein n=1 Tax=Alistipes communis TaxID=2585118 RepID=UPI00242DFDCD|nr:TonB-dependent receptor plug domain-containing protein [Alistipes communis]
MKPYTLLLLGLLLASAAEAQTTDEARLEVTVTDAASGEALGYAVCSLRPKEGNGKERAAAADARGVCLLEGLKPGRFELRLLYMGHVFLQGELQLPAGLTRRRIRLDIDPVAIGEVLVTAAESKGPTSSSKIGREAIAHIQPSSIADLMELIPGGRATDPSFGAPQEIRLREAAPSSSANYATSALGTQIQVDGIPISNDANLQYSTSYGSIQEYANVNRGVDTRAISTDDIESVEIVRGIPSVEYGDLTSGLVKVKRREGGRDLTARFKADMSSKLFSVGKGFERKGRGDAERTTLNINADYLTAASDPRNPRQSYQRLTGSVRFGRHWQGSAYRYSAGGSLDYTGSFDNKKSDQDLDNGLGGPVERYKSNYNRTQFAATFAVEARHRQFFHSLDLTASLSAEFDRIDRWRFVETGSDFAKTWGTEAGEYDAVIIPASYDATLLVDGKPFYGYAKAIAIFNADTERSRNTLRVGADWSMDKNYGRGLVFDVARPFSPQMDSRPRAYDAIPALHKLSFFLEDATTLALGDFRVEATGGVRAASMFNLGRRYTIQGKFYFDPRANVVVALPRFHVAGRNLTLRLGGGVGWHTKFPTMDSLYPDTEYFDFTQLNYWPANPALRRINLRLYTLDPTNYDLRAARNFKWEVRLDADWNDNQLSVTYFREDMTSGFRTTSDYRSFTFRDYDETAIDMEQLDGPPSLDGIPYTEETRLGGYSRSTNGSRTEKSGIEFAFTSQRIRAIATRVTVTGAYFRTNYSNMHPEYLLPTSAPGGQTYPYVGYYFSTDGYLREMCNTNFLLDTQIPRLKLILSTSFQCMWFLGSRNTPVSAWPISYLDEDLVSHPFTAESAADGLLSALVRDSDPTLWRYVTTPFSMNVNLKITKKLYRDKMAVALFVNKLLDYTPDYHTSDGRHIRREVTPYFGMELNIKL